MKVMLTKEEVSEVLTTYFSDQYPESRVEAKLTPFGESVAVVSIDKVNPADERVQQKALAALGYPPNTAGMDPLNPDTYKDTTYKG